MQLLDSGRGSAGTLLELCWRGEVAVGPGAAERHGLAAERKDLVEPWWLSSGTKSRKREMRAYVDIWYGGTPDCLIASRQVTG